MTDVKEVEDRTAEFWKKNKIYEKVKKAVKGRKKFYFLDGPPYATGAIHVGTAMNKVLKDFFIRFFRMRGFDVWDQPGYDTHGVPIENKVEKKFGFKSKRDIEKFGIGKFVNECRKFATEFVGINSKQFADLGVWMDWKSPYLTLSNDYIEGAWYTFKQGFEKGFLYKGNYSVHVCPHCSTAVAYNEIEYEKAEDPSIYVKFKIPNRPDEFLLIWTTTPWTIPSNTGVMVNPEADYVKVRVGNEIWIIASHTIESLMKKFGILKYEIVSRFKGSEMRELRYEHPLKDIFKFQQNLKNAHRIILSEQYVSLAEGTGLVHTAPGHGQEDYKVGMENGLPVINPLKMDGTFNEGSGRFSGMFAKDADKEIIQELKKRNLLVYEERVVHDYPFCWRCKTPLLMMAVPQWFFRVTAIRDKLSAENKGVKWIPPWAGERFQNWLESLGDWPVSRQRYWGIPLPIWICDKCSEIKVVGSRNELPKIPKDFHRPYIDQIVIKCKKCDGTMRRVEDVLDVWFDSGVASWATLGYPRNRKLFDRMWPADFILEGPDQIRGWWNSQMITSVITFGKSPFKSVLFHGFFLDVHGQKMAKSLGNIVTPEEVSLKYGRDVLRFFYLSGIPWEDYYFKWEEVQDIYKKLTVVKNTFNFIKTYVNTAGNKNNLKEEDRWILSKLNSLIANATKRIEEYHPHKAAQEILDFILNDFSRWYIKIIRDRVWVSYVGKDKESAFYTLSTLADDILRLLAPFTPFLSENVYQEVVRKIRSKSPPSIHMNSWPTVDEKLIDKKLEEEMEIIKQVVEAALAARQSANLKLRWPIKEVLIITKDNRVRSAVRNLEGVLNSMCNSKLSRTVDKKPSGEFSEVKFDFGHVLITKTLDEDLLNEAMLRELVREVQSLRKKNKFNVMEKIVLSLETDQNTKKIISENQKKLLQEVGASKLIFGGLRGKFKGSLEFENKTINIAFSKSK